jgi:hypothetical protein
MRQTFVPYTLAKRYLRDADILLFYPKPFPSIGWFISKYTRSKYSHVGLASIEDECSCVEFREFKGCRNISLEKYLKTEGKIDVYRAVPRYFTIKEVNGEFLETAVELTNAKRKNIVNTAKKMVGSSYSFRLIFNMMKYYVPGLRLNDYDKDDGIEPTIFVCSTLVGYAYRKHYMDLVSNYSDNQVTPGDIARSPLIRYVFTLT